MFCGYSAHYLVRQYVLGDHCARGYNRSVAYRNALEYYTIERDEHVVADDDLGLLLSAPVAKRVRATKTYRMFVRIDIHPDDMEQYLPIVQFSILELQLT